MAEEEKIREHAKHALQALTDKTKKWKDRIKDFLWEVFIILVAVNITLWFHNWSDKRHERAQVKEFLISTRESLIQDTTNIRNYITFMTNETLVYYDSILSQINRNEINTLYIDSHSGLLLNDRSVIPNYSFYQSFNSNNNLRLIENRKLLNDIISLYSASFPNLQANMKAFQDMRFAGFEKYIGTKTKFDSNGIKLSQILNQLDVKYLIQISDLFIVDLNRQSENLIEQIALVIQEIDQELKTQYGYKEKIDKALP